MGQVERIDVKRIYVGRAALFGLFYGLILGIIVAILFLAVSFFAVDFLNSSIISGVSGNNFSSTGGIILYSFILIAVYTVGSCIGSSVFALLYNMVANMGFSIHLGLAEMEKFDSSVRYAHYSS